MKATSSIVGPNDELEVPRVAEKTDWEVELGVVIGKTAKYVDEGSALDHVAGFCVVHDVSERAFKLEGTANGGRGKAPTRSGRSVPGSSPPTKCPTTTRSTCGWRWTERSTRTARR